MSGIHSCIGALFLCLLLSACSPAKKPETTAPITFTISDLEQYRWLEGTWRGTENDLNPFYERYTFQHNSLVRIYYFTDSTLAVVSDSGSVYLDNGEILHATSLGRWKASKADSITIYFEPLESAKNSFTWYRESADSWIDTLRNPGSPDIVYHLQRFR